MEQEPRTGKQGAVRFNSGLLVDHSGPGLEVGPETLATSGRTPGACPPTSEGEAFQHKSGSEVQAGEASRMLRSEAKQQFSSLDYIQSNRNTNSRENLRK